MQQIAKLLSFGRLPSFTATIFVAGLGLVGMAQKANAPQETTPGTIKTSDTATHGALPRAQVGKASWYGRAFQGKTTANGEQFNMNMLTAAHRTLPLGSWVRVTNLSNRKSVLVRINDRGPMIANRVLDLSYAAARMLKIGGLGRVSLQPVRPDDPQTVHDLLAQMQPLQPLAGAFNN